MASEAVQAAAGQPANDGPAAGRLSPEALFERNIGLAYHFARQWRQSFPEWLWEDVLAEAMVGLWKACRTYDPERGVALSTYAKRCIDNELSMFYKAYRKQCIATVSLDEAVAGLADDRTEDRRASLGSLIGMEERMFAEVEDRVFIEALPPVLRLVAAGMNQAQIARAMGKARATIQKRLRREREMVRRWMDLEGRMAG